MNYPVSDRIIHCDPDFIMHYGIKGQKWGNRRFQNPDGSLTEEGKKRYLDRYGQVNLRGWFSPNFKKLKYGAYVRKQSPYHRKDGESKEEYKARIKKFDENARKQFDAQNKKEDEMINLTKSFDKAKTSDEKAQILEKVNKNMNKALQNGDMDTYDAFVEWTDEARYDVGRTRLDEYDHLPRGPERDKKLTEVLKEQHYYGQGSIYESALLDRMQESHGDFLSRDFKSEESKKIANDFDSATKEADEIREKYYKEDQKRGKYPKDPYGSGHRKEAEIAADHPELKAAVERRDSAWTKYCEKVLKDMDMPVNDETLEYIMAVIIWN